ncbi:OSBL7 protein, partial [Casuarius casuarius]|nr:OSBL7 protein [Casuarius casuarius]
RARGSPGREPARHEGYLLKKRKWPLKGWHKRYFVLENGTLKYATTHQDVLKGKLHGSIDVRQSVMSVNKKAQRVDLDTEENIYHLKIKSPELFSSWVSSLCSHHQGEKPDPLAGPRGGPAGRTPAAAQGSWTRILPSGSAPALSALASSRDKVNAWLKDSEGLERCSAELCECQAKLQELNGMLQSLESLHRIPSAPLISHGQVSAARRHAPGAPRHHGRLNPLLFLAALGRLGEAQKGEAKHQDLVHPELRQGRHHRQAPHVPTGDVSLWNILRNNIGKDLSKVSMPVQLNEPLNTLQRLCEELEYSGLLDRASRCPDPCQRLVYVAAFAVSAYASTYYRAGSKPFNPVLGETYECVRPDRGFRFISEQVCHHPPISACHAESDNFIFWQGERRRAGDVDRGRGGGRGGLTSSCPPDMKWKNKFWGKSLEIVPMGTVNVRLPRSGDHFEWNKVTTCIHNILSGPRWIEHYGEVLIRNTRDAAFHCKITFCKVG